MSFLEIHNKPKLIRACTVPESLEFVTGMIPDLQKTFELQLLSSPGEEWQEMNGLDVMCIQVPMERRISIVKDLCSLFRIWWVFMKERPYMVHSMTPKAGLLCMTAAFFACVPRRVHTFTGLVFPTATGLKRKILMLTDWLTCAFATHVIPEGVGVMDDLKNNGITKKPMKVLGYGNVKGIDLDYFAQTPEVMREANCIRRDGKFTFIYVGRLVGDKGVNELVEAFVRLNKEHPETHLILVGPEESNLDPLKPETLQLIKDSPAIDAVGRQGNVRAWFAASDAAILPSYREGFPNVVIEAGAMGLPQIVTDINGAREIIIEGQNGTVIPPHDAEALYLAMKKFVEEPEYVKELADNARKLIADRFEQGFVRTCLYDYYRSIL